MRRLCIGIVSLYKPEREKAITETYDFLGKTFPGIPIIVIAQSYGDYRPPKIPNEITLYSYSHGLGIVRARNKLRDVFINSTYNYMIMTDDDLNASVSDVDRYLETIEKYDAVFNGNTQLNLVAISKDLYSKIPLPQYERLYFEDVYLQKVCRKFYGDRVGTFDCVTDLTWSQSKAPSTWWQQSYNYRMNLFGSATDDFVSKYSVP